MQWLTDAGMKKNVELCFGERGGVEPLPEWASFLIWLGAWMNRNQVEGGRIFCTVLLPTRSCCSALCAMGALVSSLRNPNNEISWDLFLECEEDAPVYLLYPKKNGDRVQVGGKLKKVLDVKGQAMREINLTSGGWRGVKLTVSELAFEAYKISLHPHYRRGLLQELAECRPFYKDVLNDLNENRLFMKIPDSVIVTNQAGWQRDVDNLKIGRNIENGLLYPLNELLLIRHRRVLLKSPRTQDIGEAHTRLAILDGIDAFRSRELVSSPNLLLLLDRSEYQEEVENIIRSFSQVCDRTVPDSLEPLPEAGVPEVMVNFYIFR